MVRESVAGDRVQLLDEKFSKAVRELPRGPRKGDLDAPVRAGSKLSGKLALDLVDAQFASRHLDFAMRELRARNQGFYTIGSSGHEGNAAVAAALRPTDPAFLHYRSGAFFVARAKQVPGQTPLLDVLLGAAASADDPIAGGRHKVFGSHPLAIPPQTSTIASHLPKAVGAAFALDRVWRLQLSTPAPRDAVVLCSFGDASVNHSTALGALNAAAWTAYQGVPAPVLFVCEDNAIGISVHTPEGWVENAHGHNASIRYFRGDGLDLPNVFDAATDAVSYVRSTRRPAFLHMRCVRLLAHAGSDIEEGYRDLAEIERDEAADPLLASARLVVEAGLLTPDEVMARYEERRGEARAAAAEAERRPRLSSRAQVMEPLAPNSAEAVAAEVERGTDPTVRERFWDGKVPEREKPGHLGESINRALGDLLVKYPQCLVFGEDVARKGGVYYVTHDLWRRAGAARVFNTLLDEQTILGIAIGAGQMGCLPVPEIQYLAYLHNAEDQLRGEASTLQFFSRGQFKNPMVVRVAAYGYQKGFGGHFHNDDAVAVLRDIPGLVIASPARGDDAAAMLRTCVAAAKVQGSVCIFLEPIALYMTRDLHAPGDGQWLTPYDPAAPHVAIGSPRIYGEGKDLLIVSFANGLFMSLRVAKRLEERHALRVRVMDLRWLNPLPADKLLEEARRAGRVLVVDETRRSGGVSEGVFATLIDGGFTGPLRRVASADSFVPLGDAANLVLVQEDEIEAAARALCA